MPVETEGLIRDPQTKVFSDSDQWGVELNVYLVAHGSEI